MSTQEDREYDARRDAELDAMHMGHEADNRDDECVVCRGEAEAEASALMDLAAGDCEIALVNSLIGTYSYHEIIAPPRIVWDGDAHFHVVWNTGHGPISETQDRADGWYAVDLERGTIPETYINVKMGAPS